MADGSVHLHLDCASGVSGDMFLGACLDLGLPVSLLEEMVERLGLDGVELRVERAKRGGLAGVRFSVLRDGQPVEGKGSEGASHRRLSTILRMIGESGLGDGVVERASALFRRLGEAEAQVHGVGLEEVHFHEVGADDSIVDLVGAAVALEHLDPARVSSSAVVVGSGTVSTRHGVMPVPAPATGLLLEGIPITSGGASGELTTPTGAVIVREFVAEFEPSATAAPRRIEGYGIGLGSRELADRPNALRLQRARPLELAESSWRQVAVLECQLDDVTGEAVGHAVESLLGAGALDVFATAVQMKKSRPGVAITVISRPEQSSELAERLLLETGSLGCRRTVVDRLEAERSIFIVPTPFGDVKVKRASVAGRSLGAAPEYEDVRRIAREQGVPFRDVYRAALRAAD
ncbi:MAG: nickel pincer cofactor biosynthesis protein LarC [Holophagales bacterium]|nr:nickel pincer cofactor biosynthesis protein LarC [Holophagales bacterium]MYD20634.1 nickel pincer cofactor biosynthesis protein LarC [Holophagales bacterium]MYI34236.1 nickel pincer cofactor biosynthesis protein LarC [Holophagales bacterium]